MKILITKFLCILLIVAFSASCNKDNINNYDIKGVAQKGPFISGTPVTISELDNNLKQTGKTYFTNIDDNLGYFEIPDVEFASSYVMLSADGYYFNELYGITTNERLVLTAIADLNDTKTVNINLLTHLEIERLKYLVQEKNYSFSEAKEQCYREILNIFEIESGQNISSEKLDISSSEVENSELLAISAIIQAYRNVVSLTKLLSNIQTDLKKDGVLDSESIHAELKSSAFLFNSKKVTKNLRNYYSENGMKISLSDISPIVDSFFIRSDYKPIIDIEIPESTEYGINILSLGDTVLIDTSKDYCFALNVLSKSITYWGYMGFENAVPSETRSNIFITQDDWGGWQIDDFVANNAWPLDFPFMDYIGNLIFKISFQNHGSFKVSMQIMDQGINYDFFYNLERVQYITW